MQCSSSLKLFSLCESKYSPPLSGSAIDPPAAPWMVVRAASSRGAPTKAGPLTAAGGIPNFDSIRRECGTAPSQTRHERRINGGGSKRDIVADAEDLLRQGSDVRDDARISPTLFLADHHGQDAAPVLNFCATPRERQGVGRPSSAGHMLSPRHGQAMTSRDPQSQARRGLWGGESRAGGQGCVSASPASAPPPPPFPTPPLVRLRLKGWLRCGFGV